MKKGFLWLCFAGLACRAQTMMVNDLIEEALKRNPEILQARKKLEAARQRPAQEGSLADPMFSAGYKSTGGPLPGQGLGADPVANIGFMVSQQFPAAGKRDLRRSIALKEAGAAGQQYLLVEIGVVSRLKQAYHKLHHTYEMEDIIARNRMLVERMIKVTEARYAVGKAAQQDVLKAQTQLTLLAAKAEKYALERKSLENGINETLARALDTPVARPMRMEPHESLVSLADLAERAKAWSPVLTREQRMIERSELALNLARKDGALDYTVSAGYFNMGSMPPMFEAKVDFNLPFFTRGRQRAAVNEQAYSLEAARRSYQAAGNSLLMRIKDDYLISVASWKLMRMYSTTLIPQATLTLESSLTAYETGQVDFLTLLDNLMAVLEYEMSYHEEMMNYHLALVRLEEATGMELVEED